MRGKRNPTYEDFGEDRITPADAGKTCLCWALRRNYWDHPRGCGENSLANRAESVTAGSPPRMRGKQGFYSSPKLFFGITPADAGKTLSRTSLQRQAWDHPRGCGENLYKQSLTRCRRGSPPRMRGKLTQTALTGHSPGITPADAGKTLKRSFRNQPFCSRAVQISFNFSNSLNVSLQSGSAR